MITQSNAEHWLNPWPIGFRRRRAAWDLTIMTIRRAARLYAFWRVGGVYRSIAWWARRAKTNTAPAEQHQIHSVARHLVPTMSSLTIMTIFRDGRWVVVDGNHRLIGLAMVAIHRYDKLRTPLTHVGVLARRERGKRP